MQKFLEDAIASHKAGRFAEAALLYGKVLVHDGSNASALHMLGVLHHQQGDALRAVELIGKALALEPNMPLVHANLADAFRAVGQLERAVGSCRLALKLCPDCPEALCNLGLALHVLGKRDEAADQFRRALELRPDLAPVHNNLGIILREAGQLDEAYDHFLRAVELDPQFVPALNNLGQILLERGQAAKALPHCMEAARLQPDLAAAHFTLGNTLEVLEQWVDARSAYLDALRLDPDLAPAHAHLGRTLLREFRPEEALPWLAQATTIDAENALFHEWLGDVFAVLEKPVQAICCYERALAQKTQERPSVHLSMGQALVDDGRLAEAEEQYRIALRLAPEAAAVHLGLGLLHETKGEMEAAEHAFRTSLRMQPTAALPLVQLATLLRGKLPELDLTLLEERLNDPDLVEGSRARLLFGLAHVLDARAEYDRAAQCSCEANAISLKLARRRRAYSVGNMEEITEAVINAFGPGFFEKMSGFGLDSRRPVFVFGLPRSGTTLTEQILSSHSLVHGAGELGLAPRSMRSLPMIIGCTSTPIECVGQMDGATVRRLAEQHLGWLSMLTDPPAERVIDKMPMNYVHLGLLAVLFPQATFIHCRRDLRDVAVSCWMTDFRLIKWANDHEQIAEQFRKYLRLMEHWRSILPVAVHEVHYEETIVNLEGVARRLITACGLNWEPACLEFHHSRRPVRTASVTQVRQPIYGHSIGRWKNYETSLADLFAKLPIIEDSNAESSRAGVDCDVCFISQPFPKNPEDVLPEPVVEDDFAKVAI